MKPCSLSAPGRPARDRTARWRGAKDRYSRPSPGCRCPLAGWTQEVQAGHSGRWSWSTRRQDSIDAFQDDSSVRVFIGNIQAAGTGITLAPASSVCLFAELSWVPAEISQCEDRLHWIGTLDSVTAKHLVLEGSLDAIMVTVLIRKQRILDAVLQDHACAV